MNMTFKIGCFDIEASNLKANFGVLFCASIKEMGNPKPFVTLREPNVSDKKVLNSIVRELNTYDMIISYYGKLFDFKFLRTRCAMLGLPFVKRELRHVDLYFTVRNNYQLNSNRLEVACEAFGIKGKTKLESRQWVDVISGSPTKQRKAMKYIVEHNIKDVEILEELFDVVKHNVRTISML